jgi:CO/xanthine dehydrogenase FAD-binding subunit
MTETDSGVLLNALTTLTEIETHSTINQRYEALAETAVVSATTQLQNMATMGRNLLQPSHCWRFRNPRIHCWLTTALRAPAEAPLARALAFAVSYHRGPDTLCGAP